MGIAPRLGSRGNLAASLWAGNLRTAETGLEHVHNGLTAGSALVVPISSREPVRAQGSSFLGKPLRIHSCQAPQGPTWSRFGHRVPLCVSSALQPCKPSFVFVVVARRIIVAIQLATFSEGSDRGFEYSRLERIRDHNLPKCQNVSTAWTAHLQLDADDILYSLLRLLRCVPHARFHERPQGAQQRS